MFKIDCNDDENKTSLAYIQALSAAFENFKITKNLDEFKGLGLEAFIGKIRTALSQDDSSEVESLTESFIATGDCLEKLFKRNKEKVEQCIRDKKVCPFSMEEIGPALDSCVPADLDDFIQHNYWSAEIADGLKSAGLPV